MRRFGLLFVVLPTTLLLAACGGSKHSSTTTATTAVTTSSTSVTTTNTGAPATSGSTATSTTISSTSSHPTTSLKPPPTNARVPATFTIHAGGSVQPPTISIPARLAVQLTVVSGDGKVHHVVLRTITPYPLTVPANGRASVLIPGQRVGTYALDVDGARKAALMIGGQPGP